MENIAPLGYALTLTPINKPVEPGPRAGAFECIPDSENPPGGRVPPTINSTNDPFYQESPLTNKIMLTKFAIDYIVVPQHNKRITTHFTDDPVEAEDFLMHLLLARARITEVRHEGTVLTGSQFNRMLKTAAERVASSLLRESLLLDAAEIKDRFGFAA